MPDDNMEHRDAVIIGGGPAGTVAGAYLARGGLKPLILEKETFPRFAIGESLLPGGNDILKDLGIWSELERGGYLKKFGADFTSGHTERFNRYWFRNALGKTHEHTFQVERASFDHLLLNHARHEGCDVLEKASVTRIQKTENSHTEIHFKHGDSTKTVRCRWVVDASGRSGIVGSQLGIPKSPTRSRKMVAIYGHFKGVRRNQGEAAGHTVIVRFKDGWFWFIPLSMDKTSVGAVVPAEHLREFKAGLQECFDHCLSSTPDAKSRMTHAASLQPLRATADYSWRFQTFALDGVVLTGDAAGFVDPIFSSGVMLAMKSAQLAAGLILKADQERRHLTRAECRDYTREVTRWMNHYRRIIRSFYDRAGFEMFMHPLSYFQIPRAIGLLVGGQMDLSLGERLRIRTFGLLCRLQRLLNIAPAIASLR